jgi:hypothetical protein
MRNYLVLTFAHCEAGFELAYARD